MMPCEVILAMALEPKLDGQNEQTRNTANDNDTGL
jgi:hypothetical protein